MTGNENLPSNNEGEKSAIRQLLETTGFAIATVVGVGALVLANIMEPNPFKVLVDQQKQAELERAHELLPNCAPVGVQVTFEGVKK